MENEKWFKWSDFFISLGLAILCLIVIRIKSLFDGDWNALRESAIESAITLLIMLILINFCLSIKSFLVQTLKNHKQEINSKLSKIDNCPRITALHTEEKVFENKIKLMDKVNPSQRWLLAKYISKLLSKSFYSFSIKINAIEYSKFSGELFLESKKSIQLTGSMIPSEWLYNLAVKNEQDDRNKVKGFFNNVLPFKIGDYPIDENNHSIILKNCNHIGERLRIVCIDSYDWKYNFISERSLDAYYSINDEQSGLKTFFLKIDDNPAVLSKNKMNPKEYEYALYDDEILLKWRKSKTSGELSLLIDDSSSNNDEISEVREFFRYHKSGNSKLYDYTSLKEKIHHDKLRLLKDILESSRLPHKYCYLYGGGVHWKKFVRREEIKYSDVATIALQEGLSFFHSKILSSKDKISIVEIGSGSGDRISTICDCIGSNNIKKYLLIDISRSLLQEAEETLRKRLSDSTCIEKSLAVDCCESTKILKEKTTLKHVFIPINSTLFTEPGFELRNLSDALSIFITLDMYKTDADSFSDHIKAKELLLYPLKTFEIPIDDNILELFENFLFSHEYKDNTFNIYFNLKLYIGILTQSVSLSNFHNYSDEPPANFSHTLGQNKNTAVQILAPNKLTKKNLKNLHEDYIVKRKMLFEQKRLNILSSLKFDNEKNAVAHLSITGFKVDKKISSDGKFISLLLTRDI